MSAQPDPVFAAISRWRALWDAYMAACAMEDNAESYAAATAMHGPAYDALRAVYMVEPSTPAGLLALMAVMLEADGDHLDLIDVEKPDDLDDAQRGLIAVFHHAKRMLEAAQWT